MKTDSSLHRAGKRPDWSKVSRRRWNIWQRVAGNSGGVLTVGNVFTLIGFCLVLAGLMMVAADMNWSGLVLIAVGRICDLLDGWLAERTKTKSPLGEMLDTTADKLETAAALVVLTVFGVLPWPAALLEGLTEFLPVSSTGHLILAGHALDFTGARASTFEVFIQLGAILAVVWLYRQRFLQLLEFGHDKGLQGKRGIGLLLLTTLPALIFGFLFHGFIKDNLFQPQTVAIGLAVGGVALIVFERFPHKAKVVNVDNITAKQALGIGLFQLLSLWPGVSRAASTIIGGMIQGLDRKTAVEYSFLIAVPVMIAATGYDLLKSLPNLQASDTALFAVGFVTAFVSALLAVRYFVQFVQRFGFTAFGWYRSALAALGLIILV